jgi:hypothetical protein
MLEPGGLIFAKKMRGWASPSASLCSFCTVGSRYRALKNWTGRKDPPGVDRGSRRFEVPGIVCAAQNVLSFLALTGVATYKE